MPYSVGGLQIDFTTGANNAQAIKDLHAVANGLRSLSKAVQGLNSVNTIRAGAEIKTMMENISSASRRIDTTALHEVASLAKSLSSVSRIGNLEKVDWDKIGTGFETLTTKITPFLNEVKGSETALNSLYGILDKFGKNKNISNVISGKSSDEGGGLFSLSGLFNIGKIRLVAYYAKRIATTVAKIAQSGSDYIETLNYWAVAMRNNLDMADEFVDKMSKAYGISEKTLMNAQATFKNMIGSLGQVTADVSDKLSQAVTQMAIDYASLYNVTIEKSLTKFQAALAGQVRPIRSTSGYDITETTLYQLYQSIGGTKSMRQLNRTEKQLLSILAIYRQMQSSGATGDMAKTLNFFANQSRIMAEQWERIKTYSGLLLRNFIDDYEILVHINAVLIVIAEIFKTLSESTTKETAQGFADIEFSANDAADAIENLQGKLLDFDKFRSLQSADEEDTAIDETLLNALSDYESAIDGAKNKAQELADSFLSAIGFDNKENVIAYFKEIKSLLEAIAITMGIIAGYKIAGAIGNFITSLSAAAFSATALSKVFSVMLIAGIFMVIYGILDLVKNWNDLSDAQKAVRFLIIGVGTALMTLVPLLKLSTAYSGEFLASLIKWAAPIIAIVGAVALLTIAIVNLVEGWQQMTTLEKVIGILTALAAAIALVGAAIALVQGSFKGIGGIMLGIGGALAIAGTFATLTGTLKNIPKYADGGVLPDKGSLFIAGEAGAEIVYNNGNGSGGGVANVQQIAQANYQGTMQALNDWWGGRQAKNDIPQLERASDNDIYQAAARGAKSHGQKFAKV